MIQDMTSNCQKIASHMTQTNQKLEGLVDYAMQTHDKHIISKEIAEKSVFRLTGAALTTELNLIRFRFVTVIHSSRKTIHLKNNLRKKGKRLLVTSISFLVTMVC